MVSTLDVDLRPGFGLGLFEIGTSLWTVLDLLRHNTTLFPRVDVKYDPDASANTPVLLHIPPHIDLLFSGAQQRLRTIALRRLRDPHPPVSLTYRGTVLSDAVREGRGSSGEVLRRGDVSRHFGPTYAGEGLQYPGVSFLFEEDGVPEALKGTAGAGAPGREDRAREVKRVVVSQTSPDSGDSDPLDEVAECASMAGNLRQAVVTVHEGIILHFYPSTSAPVHVRIGVTSAQDLTCDLGAPLRIYYKEDERMAIHSRNKTPDGTEDGYFYNYFQYGIDFLISGSTHLVQKVILHTNIPGTPMFQRYQRCPWAIEGQPEDEEDDAPPRVKFSDKFDIISRFLNRSTREQVPSMQLDRTEDERLTLPSSTTRLVGFNGIVLEVTEAAQIATVVLF